jgi:preprotein translocase subunit SecD
MKQSSNKGHARQRSNGRKRSNSNNNGNRKNSFDSTGPVGKIRGTAAYVQEKYMAAAKDALSNSDFVLAESCYQHADHYTRIYNSIAEAKLLHEQQRKEKQQQREEQKQVEIANVAKIEAENIDASTQKTSEKIDISENQKQEAEEIKPKAEKKPVRERKPRRTYTRKKTVIDTAENVTVVAAPEIMSV